MAFSLRRRGPSKFQQAADGSMTLVEHVRELRDRLFKASLAVVLGFIVGYLLAQPVFNLLERPYCNLAPAGEVCKPFLQLAPTDAFVLQLKLSLWIGLIVAAPVWLYQLWAFIAPGLHRHERKYAYIFAAIAAPLFISGAVLAYLVVERGLAFLLEAGVTGLDTQLEVTRYVSFVTGLILLFGVSFEFPLIVLMLNFTGLASARRLLGFWRVAVFLSFAFAAITTPDPGPFGMILLASCLSALYFLAVGVAFLNDRRRGRGRELYAGLADDETSPLDTTVAPVGAGDPVEPPAPVTGPTPVTAPLPLESRYDDTT